MTGRVLLLVAAATIIAACQAVPSFVPPTPFVTSPVEGVVIAVDSAGLGDVRGFTLRPTSVPFAFSFVIGTLENAAEFSPGHLAEHQATSEPVRVYFRRTDDGEHVVYRLEDASEPPAS
ncbi:MAG: hypothetical protein L0221_02035 [Chloroflexi bacterium]|nr:hypothetical protein [Chloroflexota bacterium]